MSRLPQLSRGASRRVSWQVVLGLAMRIAQEGRRRWDRLSPREQRELVRILRESRGRVGNVTPGERAELRRLVVKAGAPERR